jgi:hypothetical protein
MGAGPSVRVMVLVPLSPHEYDQVRGGGASDWLSRNVVDERLWAPIVARIR